MHRCIFRMVSDLWQTIPIINHCLNRDACRRLNNFCGTRVIMSTTLLIWSHKFITNHLKSIYFIYADHKLFYFVWTILEEKRLYLFINYSTRSINQSPSPFTNTFWPITILLILVETKNQFALFIYDKINLYNYKKHYHRRNIIILWAIL